MTASGGIEIIFPPKIITLLLEFNGVLGYVESYLNPTIQYF